MEHLWGRERFFTSVSAGEWDDCSGQRQHNLFLASKMYQARPFAPSQRKGRLLPNWSKTLAGFFWALAHPAWPSLWCRAHKTWSNSAGTELALLRCVVSMTESGWVQ